MNRIIVDAHLHLPIFPELMNFEDKKRRLLADLDRDNITAAVVIPFSITPSGLGNNEELIELLSGCENIHLMATLSPFINYEANLTRVEDYLQKKKVVAIKIYPGHEEFYVNDPRLEKVFSLCKKYNVPLAVHTGWKNPHFNEPKLFAEVARKHPDMKMINCHLWYPETDYCYEVTKEYENIYYEISSIGSEKDSISKVMQTLTRVAQENPHRLLFGTDYGFFSFLSHIELVDNLSVDNNTKELIFYKNAAGLFRLNL